MNDQIAMYPYFVSFIKGHLSLTGINDKKKQYL